MKQFTCFCAVICIIKLCSAQYEGPYLLFGPKALDSIQIPSLRAIDDRTLRELYSNASSVMIFVKNETTKLNYQNFPKLSELIQKNSWLYLTQQALSSDPQDFNVNAEVYTLTGSSEQQDGEMAALFRDSQIAYGENNVLGLLATRDLTENRRMKRQAFETSTTESITENTTDDSVIFEAKGKALLYSENKPVVVVRKNTSEPRTYYLDQSAIVTSDERKDEVFKIILKYPTAPNSDLGYVKFNFRQSGGNWYLDQVEVNNNVLNYRGVSPPSAPMGFSYACNETFTYKYKSFETATVVTLSMTMIQAQPDIKTSNGTHTAFGKVWDCVGILTPAIAAGIFVTFVIGIVLSIALSAIMDIKPPNKFETKSSKQLTFTVQE